jgi:uncharacterized protein
MNSPLQTVQSIYQAFGSGDIPAILAPLAADVRWDDWAGNSAQQAGVPLMRARRGPDQVLAFFQALASVQKMHSFKVVDLVGGSAAVAAEIEIDFTVTQTGRRYHDEEMHLSTFNAAGQVSRFRHYLDTAKLLRAFALGTPA